MRSLLRSPSSPLRPTVSSMLLSPCSSVPSNHASSTQLTVPFVATPNSTVLASRFTFIPFSPDNFCQPEASGWVKLRIVLVALIHDLPTAGKAGKQRDVRGPTLRLTLRPSIGWNPRIFDEDRYFFTLTDAAHTHLSSTVLWRIEKSLKKRMLNRSLECKEE